MSCKFNQSHVKTNGLYNLIEICSFWDYAFLLTKPREF